MEGSSRPYRLRREESVGAGLTRVAAGRADSALQRLRGVRVDDPALADAVHGARKDLKKLRSVLRLLRDGLGERRFREENRRCRDAGRALAGSRDAEVRLRTLEGLIEAAAEPPAAAFAWRRLLERDREEARAAVGEAGLKRAVELIEAEREAIGSWRFGEGEWKLIDAAVLRTYRRGRREMRQAEAEGGAEHLHEWRKRAKDLWYDLRLLGEVWPQLLDPTAEEAHRLSELLGDHHDLAVLREDLENRQLGAETTDALAAAIATRQEELADEAFALGHRLYAERPKEFRRRLRRCWRAWRG